MTELKEFLDNPKILIYLLGYIVFVSTILDHKINPKRKIKPIYWYIQEALYTGIMIAASIALCSHFELSLAINKLISILMGIIGPTIIRKIKKEKDTLSDTIIDIIKRKTKK